MKLFSKKDMGTPARALYALAVGQARRPEFYEHLGLLDTTEGRLEAVMLHVWLLLHRLKGKSDTETARLSQTLFDVLFEDMDQSLREMGVGDMGVSRRIKAMAESFMGRIAAYDAGLTTPENDSLEGALRRNFYRTLPGGPSPEQIGSTLAYVRTAAAALKNQPSSDFLLGKAVFPAPMGGGPSA